jgi:hypothetical protein
LFHIRCWSDALRGDVGRAPDPLTAKYDPRDMSRVFVRRMNGRRVEARDRDLRRPTILRLAAAAFDLVAAVDPGSTSAPVPMAFELIVPEASASIRNAAGNLRHDSPHYQPLQGDCHDGCRSTILSGPSRLAQKVLELPNRNGQDCDNAVAEHAARRHCGIDARKTRRRL